MGEQLLEQFAISGFSGLVSDEPTQLVGYLERAAKADDSDALSYLAEAIKNVDKLRREHDERGGVRGGFLKKLDHLTADSIVEVLVGDPEQRTKAAIAYRDQIVEMLSMHDVETTYEDD